MKSALVLAPHTDDAEFGCGGTISRLVREGWSVRVVAYSHCDNPQLLVEYQRSMDILGVHHAEHRDYPVRRFGERRQDILEDMVRMAERTPDLVFVPNTDDVHQDHQTVQQEALRAFKRCTLLGYELPWNSYTFHSTAFVTLAEQDVVAKCTALRLYASQAERPYANDEFIRSWARMRGTAIGTTHAEAFQSIRHIL